MRASYILSVNYGNFSHISCRDRNKVTIPYPFSMAKCQRSMENIKTSRSQSFLLGYNSFKNKEFFFIWKIVETFAQSMRIFSIQKKYISS